MELKEIKYNLIHKCDMCEHKTEQYYDCFKCENYTLLILVSKETPEEIVFDNKYNFFRCPRCRAIVSFKNRNYVANYCNKCGQAIYKINN